MPNWCDNDITITADTNKELQEFITYVGDEDSVFSFTKILPCDEVSKEDVWGTKWSAEDANMYASESDTEDDPVVEYAFLTAWTPPYGIYKVLAERFPNIDINWYYREEGNRIAGYMHPEEKESKYDKL